MEEELHTGSKEAEKNMRLQLSMDSLVVVLSMTWSAPQSKLGRRQSGLTDTQSYGTLWKCSLRSVWLKKEEISMGLVKGGCWLGKRPSEACKLQSAKEEEMGEEVELIIWTPDALSSTPMRVEDKKSTYIPAPSCLTEPSSPMHTPNQGIGLSLRFTHRDEVALVSEFRTV